MASSFVLNLFSLIALFLYLSCAAPLGFKPNGIILPVRKELTTLQYYTVLQMGSTRQRHNLVIDLGGQNLWINCDDYMSSLYRPIPCGSHRCEYAKGIGCIGCSGSPKPGCTNDTCGGFAYNPYSGLLYSAGLGEDSITLTSKGPKVPHFIFSCSGSSVLEGLASGIIGIAGLAKTNISLQNQILSVSNLADKFALCVPSGRGSGSIFVGGVQSQSLITTPLVVNPISTAPVYSEGDHSNEYFIDVKAIKVDGKVLNIKTSLLAIDNKGVGGTKLSTIANFTILHSSIYKAITREFVKRTLDMKIKRVASVMPFKTCFSSKTIVDTATGPNVPTIDLVLQTEAVYWRIHGHNSMVRVSKDVMCLALIDGGKEPRTSIVLGGHQLEDNLIEFDLASSKLGFSNSLLNHNTNCSS